MPRKWERRGEVKRWWEREWSGRREMGAVGWGWEREGGGEGGGKSGVGRDTRLREGEGQ